MPFDLREIDDCVPRFLVEPGDQEKALQGDEGVSTPAARVARREVRESSTHGALELFEYCRRHASVHLKDSASQFLEEGILATSGQFGIHLLIE